MSDYLQFLQHLDDLVSDRALAIASLVCLSIVALNSVSMLLAVKRLQDPLRVVGHVLLGLWATSRIAIKLVTMHTTPEHLVLHMGLALLSLSALLGLFDDSTRR